MRHADFKIGSVVVGICKYYAPLSRCSHLLRTRFRTTPLPQVEQTSFAESVVDMSDTSAQAPLGPRDVDEVATEIKALTNQVAAVTARFSSVRRVLSKHSLDPEDKFSQYHKVLYRPQPTSDLR